MTPATSLPPTANTFFIAGGTLARDAACYVTRKADTDLREGLRQGQFCYVLTSRQMGKSSLMVRTATQLRQEGIAVAVVDLTAMGQNATPEQWYDGLINRIGRQLGLETEFDDFWLNNERLAPLPRFLLALQEVALRRLPGQIVLFVDEIDVVRSLPFSTDEFFAGIRQLYNQRVEASELRRLTFALFGVAAPADLIRDTRTTPFNIGKRIELRDFTAQEAATLAYGLHVSEPIGKLLLNRILYWTGGHPYLTQRLCQAFVNDVSTIAQVTAFLNSDSTMVEANIDYLCNTLFLSSRARERDDNLLFVRERLLRNSENAAALLRLYIQIHEGQTIIDNDSNPTVNGLHLSGAVRAINGCLQVRNLIYRQVFDMEWAQANMPMPNREDSNQPVRLLGRQRIRGIMPLSANSLTYKGRTLIVCSDETDANTYHAFQWKPEGGGQAIVSVMVEPLHRIEISADAQTLLGYSNNALYVFESGRKRRLLTNKHGGYSDVALTPDGHFFAFACSDIQGIAYSVGVCNVNGKNLWEKMVVSPVHHVALSADARVLVAGCADGTMFAIDSGRNMRWRHQKEPVTAVALNKNATVYVIGTERGTLFVLNEIGNISWRHTLGIPIWATAVSETGDCIAVVTGNKVRSTLIVLNGDGQALGQTTLEGLPTGVSMALDGSQVSVSLANGNICMFAVAAGSMNSEVEQSLALQEAEEQIRIGDLLAAYQQLREQLLAHPEHLEVAKRLNEVGSLLVAQRLDAVSWQSKAVNPLAALSLLEEVQRKFPYDTRLFQEQQRLYKEVLDYLNAEVQRHLKVGDIGKVCDYLAELLRADPYNIAVREQYVFYVQQRRTP